MQVFPTLWERETRPGTEAMLVFYVYIRHLAKLTYNSGRLVLGSVCVFSMFVQLYKHV